MFWLFGRIYAIHNLATRWKFLAFELKQKSLGSIATKVEVLSFRVETESLGSMEGKFRDN
jgi:hypothetical protein